MLVKEDSSKKISFHFSGKNQFSYCFFFDLTLAKYFCHLVLDCYRILPFLIGKAKWQKKCDYHGNEREKHIYMK